MFLGQRTVLFRAAEGRTDPHFLLFALMSRRGQDHIALLGAGSLHKHMRVADAARILVPASPFREQVRVGRLLASEFGEVDRASRAMNLQITLLQERRQALISAAVTGQLDLTAPA